LAGVCAQIEDAGGAGDAAAMRALLPLCTAALDQVSDWLTQKRL
jgi:hypothetical protein